jgi:hypothetical protein
MVGWRSNLKNSNITYNGFRSPTNPEKASKRNRNVSNFANLASKILNKSRDSTFSKLQLLGRENEEGASQKVYDDELVRTMSEEFTDRVRTLFVIGDAIRAFRGSLNRSELGANEFIEIALNKIASRERIFREDVAKLTKIAPVTNNFMMPFMNGGPAGENWDNATNGFYDWIDNKSQETILGIELGFKADSYGLEVSRRLIAKKNKTPSIKVNLLIDGFVSILMQKPPATLSDFERNTIRMIDDMRKAGINVFDNDSWNPLSADFLAANHIKLWIFDGRLAFVGGIGIESQFRTLLYDEMDSIQGPFVKVLTAMALLLMTNQKGHEDLDNQQLNVKPIYQMNQEELKKLFIKDTLDQGSVNMRISMDVPGFVQDAQHDYIDLLTRKDVDEIFIMAPYFSDHKVAKALVIAADRLVLKYGPQKSQSKLKVADTTKKLKNLQLGNHTLTPTESDSNTEKKIHVIFPKKPEDRIIAEVSRYYAYYLRKNPIVETLQFYAEVNSEKFEMLHAKQMIVVLKDENRNWTKYVKFGGSYNPAGRAQNMWEINTVSINRSWDDSDEGPNAAEDNPIKNYLQNVMKVVTTKYTQPFPWGQRDEKLSLLGRIEMGIARSLWF